MICDVSEKLYGKNDRKALDLRIDRIDNNLILGLFQKSLDEAFDVYYIAKTQGYNDFQSISLFYIAKNYLRIENLQKALEYYNKIPKNNNFDSWKKGEIAADISRIYLLLSEPNKAFDSLNKYYQSIKAPNDIDKYLYYEALARMYAWQGKYDEAMKFAAKTETYINKVDESNKRLLIGFDFFKTQLYTETDNFNAARNIYKEIKYYLDSNTNNAETENLYLNNMYYYNTDVDVDNFNKYYKLIEKYYEDYPEDALRNIEYKEQKIVLLQQADLYDDAIPYTKEVLNDLDSIKDIVPAYYARILHMGADNFIKTNRTEDAKNYLKLAAEYYRKVLPETAYVFKNINFKLAKTYKKENNLNEAVNYYNKALQYALKAQNDKDLALIYTFLAECFGELNQKEKAIECIDKAIEQSVKSYGDANSLTYDRYIKKYKLYKYFKMHQEADMMQNEINNKISLNGITGIADRIRNEVGLLNSYSSIEKEDKRKALLYAKEAKQNISKQKEDRNVKKLYYDIYSQNGNKIKALRYKKYAKIQKDGGIYD